MDAHTAVISCIKLLKRKQKDFLMLCRVKEESHLHGENYAYYQGVETTILRLQGIARKLKK